MVIKYLILDNYKVFNYQFLNCNETYLILIDNKHFLIFEKL